MSTSTQDRLLSHVTTPQSLEDNIAEIRQRIIAAGDRPYASIEKQLALLAELTTFELGRFLLQNRGLNGYWTHYILTHPEQGRKTGLNQNGKPLALLEKQILDRCPVVLATQERFKIFLRQNQQRVRNNARLACIPCGLMGELLYLDLMGIDSIELIGIDYDANTLASAQALAKRLEVPFALTLEQQDAWQLSVDHGFDLISSNGLNIYEPDDAKVTALYQRFYEALKPGGMLVTSFLTPLPNPDHREACEWDMRFINQEDLILQRILFADIIATKWQSYRSTEQTRLQLQQAGFAQIEFFPDQAHIFPTVVAIK